MENSAAAPQNQTARRSVGENGVLGPRQELASAKTASSAARTPAYSPVPECRTM